MSTNKGSFAQRVASMASTIENWDDDGDFQGDIFTNSMSTIQTMSSRVSVRSESNTGDDDWQVLLTPNDELSTLNAITSAKQAGIPIPTSVPSSALLGGSIKRLGKKKSTRKIAVDDDWGDDLELPSNANEGLKLKAPQVPRTPAEEQDDFDDWGEGSLGIRFGGTRREGRGGRSSSVSAMSPSIGSCMTLESEDDDLTGLVLPNEPLDFNARLEKLKKTEHLTPDVSPLPPQHKRELPPTSVPTPSPAAPPTSTPPLNSAPIPEPKLKARVEEDDFLDGLDIGVGDVLDTKKLTLNRNVVVKKQPTKTPAPPAARPATTLTFTDKPSASRIPRPLPSTSRSRLTPVYETGASTLGHNRPMPTTTSAQLLRAKRSAPVLRNNYSSVSRPPVPFLPAGNSNSQSHHITAKSSQPHLRRDSDPNRPHSPSMRSYSRMSATNPPDTPSRAGSRRDVAPAALAREAASKRIVAKPKTRRNYGDGSELEVFDDLPTSASKEKKYEKVPRNLQGNKAIRHQPSSSRLPMPDRIATPMPQTPRSPTKADSTPRFARDTAASRIAREQRLAGTRSRGEGPIAPTQTNWKAQVAARSPHGSPTAQRKRGTGQKPVLIKAMSAPMAKNEKGMTYNPIMQRWEGNEDALAPFSHPNTSTTTLALTTASTPTFAPPNRHFYNHDRSHSISHSALSAVQAAHAQKSISSRAVNIGPPSPPRAPALISNISTARGVQVERGMVFDPSKMRWLKLGRSSRPGDPRSPSVDLDDEDDPFAGLEDLKDNDITPGTGGSTGNTPGGFGDVPQFEQPAFIGEEFDLGPKFIRRQREEENVWKHRVEGWVGGLRDNGESKGGWRWTVREFAELAAAEASRR
ncbi:hypothetical protein K469DRAFT_585452 [Zopfia rhizophila CBS 207.26]|uniref:Cytokinesis regulator n=1 Tax=Zopfia rhizophila CBS 207.26 TaxID=1314779 RepID=A0A6A6DSZ3_9PEZI|nr:hypothetical protein K469DRAFT_585452 [Zopfia rhizophila CBS 207.26]